jgi:hypothetical protein
LTFFYLITTKEKSKGIWFQLTHSMLCRQHVRIQRTKAQAACSAEIFAPLNSASAFIMRGGSMDFSQNFALKRYSLPGSRKI